MLVHTWIFYIFCWFSWVEPHKPQKILSLHQISAECNLLLQAWPTTGRCWGNKAKSQKATRSSTLVLHHENYVWILVLQTGLSVFWLVDTKRNYDQFLSTIYPITYKGPDQNCASPIKRYKCPAWICWIYFRPPIETLEVLWCHFFLFAEYYWIIIISKDKQI